MLQDLDVPFHEIDVTTEDGSAKLHELGYDVVPIVAVGDTLIRGFNEARIRAALGENRSVT